MAKVNITLPDDLIERTKTHAQKKGKTFSGMCRVGLEQQLSDETTKESKEVKKNV